MPNKAVSAEQRTNECTTKWTPTSMLEDRSAHKFNWTLGRAILVHGDGEVACYFDS